MRKLTRKEEQVFMSKKENDELMTDPSPKVDEVQVGVLPPRVTEDAEAVLTG